MTLRRSLIVLFLLGGCLVSCEKQDTKPEESLSLEVHRDSITDFCDFLEGVSHMISDQPVTLSIPGRQADRKLKFGRLNGLPCEPFMIRVSADSVSIGYDVSRPPVTMEELHKTLALFNSAAKATNSPGLLYLHSERQVSGEFGLSILEVLADSGIDFVALAEPDRHEKTSSGADRPKPKPPSPWESGSRIVR